MFERFTEGAIKTLMLALGEAERFGQDHCGSEHILLGLLGVNGIAAAVMKSKGLTLSQARDTVGKAIGRKSLPVSKPWFQRLIGSFKETPFTTSARKVLELSWEEARTQKLNYIDDDFLFLALLRLDEGIGSEVLREHCENLDEFRKEVLARKKL